jgi:hypothetical protein
MDILPVNNLTRVNESTRNNNQEQPPKRPPQRKREKIAPTSVYTPDGHVEEGAVSKIDVIG